MSLGRTVFFALATGVVALAAQPASADDAVSTYRIESVVERPDFASQTQGVQFYFGDAQHPPATRSIEQNVTTSLRTRKFGRSNEEACQWVMMSALGNAKLSAARNAVPLLLSARVLFGAWQFVPTQAPPWAK